MIRRSPRHLRRRSQRGAVLVEAALVIPVLIIFIMGVVDLSVLHQDKISLRNGVREAARQGGATRFGGNDSCALNPVPTNANTRQLACMLKRRTELDQTRIRVKFRVISEANPASGAAWAPGELLLVCAMSQATSTTRFFAPALDGRVQVSRMTAMIERPATGGFGDMEETPLAGQTWSWCDATAPPPA